MFDNKKEAGTLNIQETEYITGNNFTSRFL